MNKFIINKKTITIDTPPYIIAEVGHNHKDQLIFVKTFFRSKRCGASAVKLQKEIIKKFFQKECIIEFITQITHMGKHMVNMGILEFGFKITGT